MVMMHRDAGKGEKILFMVAGLGLATPAAGSQDLSIAGPEFIATWKTLTAQTVQITGGRVYGARLDSALLSVPWGQHYSLPKASCATSSSTAPLIGAGRV